MTAGFRIADLVTVSGQFNTYRDVTRLLKTNCQSPVEFKCHGIDKIVTKEKQQVITL